MAKPATVSNSVVQMCHSVFGSCSSSTSEFQTFAGAGRISGDTLKIRM
jgi:hypothetical protein